MYLRELFPRSGYDLLAALWVHFLLIHLPLVEGLAATPVRKVARMDGDLIIGALFSVHDKPPDDDKASRRECGAIREQYGIQRVEVMLKTISQINEDPEILPGVWLGCEIRDSCWFSSVALEQSLEFLSDSLNPMEDIAEVSADDQQTCTEASAREMNPIVAVIGPGSSTVSIQVQNLLQLFNIPQVAYSATSKDLSDKSIYKTFLRVCPPDTMQAQAMVDIARRYNWTYVSAVYTEGNYGSSGFVAFKNLAHREGICIAKSEEIGDTAGDEEVEAIVSTLLETPTARVVICFCQGETVRKLLNATKRMNINRFHFIGSDGWANRKEVTKDLEKWAAGSITIKPHTNEYEQFNEYYFNLDPLNNTRNPWFRDFWEQKFNCRLEDDDDSESITDQEVLHPCRGNESLQQGYQQDTKMGSVVNAIYAVAHALHDMHGARCPNSTLCDAMRPVDGRDLLKFLYNVSFQSKAAAAKELIKFDKTGDPIGRYDLFYFDKNPEDGVFDYHRFGEWYDGQLKINDSAIAMEDKDGGVVESFCSKPCEKGQAKNIRDNLLCCWLCVPCNETEILIDAFTCKKCNEGYAPNANLTDCDKIKVEFMRWTEGQAILAIVLASIGLICTSFVFVTFIRFNGTPIIKASSRENSYILLVGITMCFALTFPYVSKPSTIVCYLQRICLGLGFCLCYASLVVRTNRMARILAGSKKKILTRKPRFLSGTAQVVITLLIISVEVGIIVIFLILEPPEAVTDYSVVNQARLICRHYTNGMIAPIGYDAFLVGMCTLYAFKTRNLPENFNEAKYIAFTMYTTCVVWLAFIPLYFGSAHMRESVVCFAVSLSAGVALACLFLPKTYIILFKPEKNRRSSMTTSTLVRMHVGSFYDSSSRNFSSNNGTVDFSREQLLRTKSNNSRSSTGSRRSSIFASFRRRNNSVPASRNVMALERDRNQRRRMPVYRYSSSSPQGTSPSDSPRNVKANTKWMGYKRRKGRSIRRSSDIIPEASTSEERARLPPLLPPPPHRRTTNDIETIKPSLARKRTRSLDGGGDAISNGDTKRRQSVTDVTKSDSRPISKSADDVGNDLDPPPQYATVVKKTFCKDSGPNGSPRIIINSASSNGNIPSPGADSYQQINYQATPLQLTDNYSYPSSRENSISDLNSDVIIVDADDVIKDATSEKAQKQLKSGGDGIPPLDENKAIPQSSSHPMETGNPGSPFANDGMFDELLAMLVELKSSDV